MKIVHWTVVHLTLLIFCVFHLCDGRLDFWNLKKAKPVSDLNPNKFSPVIFIPGAGGNKLQARLNKDIVPHYWCFKRYDYFDLWLDAAELVPGVTIDCWVDNIRLTYDNVTRKTNNTPGVETRLPKWGQTEDLEWVDTTPVIDRYDFGAYYTYIAEALVKRGYERGRTLFGAPYDFRRGPNENKHWFELLKYLTENAYNMNDNIGVTFIAHSMGGRMILYFLQQMPQEWKDKYVKQVITLSVPWGGSVQAIQAISVGYDFGAAVIQNIKMNQVQKTCPSVVWLMPSENFWKPHEVLATMKNKSYTLESIDQFFRDIGNPYAVEMRKDLAGYNNFTAPGVEMHCLYGYNVGDTVERLEFGGSYNQNPALVKGNGDGTVNLRSLIGCGHWENTPAQGNHNIYQQQFPGVEHYNMLSDAGPINYILNKLTGDHNYPSESESRNHVMMKWRLF